MLYYEEDVWNQLKPYESPYKVVSGVSLAICIHVSQNGSWGPMFYGERLLMDKVCQAPVQPSNTVDGSEFPHQLIWSYPIICKVLYIPTG